MSKRSDPRRSVVIVGSDSKTSAFIRMPKGDKARTLSKSSYEKALKHGRETLRRLGSKSSAKV